MKRFTLVFLIISFYVLGGYAQSNQVVISDDDSYTTPANGAVLDVYSTTKGFIVPRMTTVQRTSLADSIPANGVVVYDTDLKSFYYWETDAWQQIAASGLNLTNIQFGDASNYSTFEADGTLLMVGDATVWDDLRVPLTEPSTGTVKPIYDIFPYGASDPGVYINWFHASGVDEMYFVVQIPHSWEEGTTIYPHIHWVPSENGAAGPTVPRWGLQYAWLNLGETFTSYTTIYGTTTYENEVLVKDRQYLTPLGADGIDGTGKTISSMLVCRIFRDGNSAEDTFSGLAGALEVDFHFEINTIGSRHLYTKQ